MIHKYKLCGYNIVLDINSGAVHVVDELVYDMLDNISPPFEASCSERVANKLSRFYDKEEIITCYEEIRKLHESGTLFSEDDYEKFTEQSADAPLKAMCLIVEQDCNLRCEYCFAEAGKYGFDECAAMDFKVGKKAIDFLIKNSKERKNLEIDFFGGEPLMNFEVVKKITEYARSKGKRAGKIIRFTLTTNGILLDDEKINFINKEMSNVVLSLDGRKETNDRVRKRLDGTGCYDKAISEFKTLADRRGHENYYIRGTFTKYNLDFTSDVYHLYEQGFDQISIEPVIGKPDMPCAVSDRDLPRIFSEYEILAKRILADKKRGKGFNFFHFMLDLDQGPCAIKRLRGCGAGSEYVAVTPDGGIYPCHQFAGFPEYKMGSVLDGEMDKALKKTFAGSHIYSKSDCVDCWAKFYCSGGCNANNYIFNGDIRMPHRFSCLIQKKRLECAIMMKAALADEV
ncbi:MAG: thioether cross-link-forming SCIFF peptide maturase [Oscillospiraceae bacterium]|nr:thioether cross-link-forming SCIFF peptide maturase [Oscillospiraceae bacterium]